MKKFLIVTSFLMTGCSTVPVGYMSYLEQTSKLSASQNAAEAACLLVLAEGMKTGDAATKTILASQIDRCRKDPIQIQPPRNIFGLEIK